MAINDSWIIPQGIATTLNNSYFSTTTSGSPTITGTYSTGTTFTINWDANGIWDIANPSGMYARAPKGKKAPAGYGLRGYFQGREFDVFIDDWDDSPIEAVMRKVLGLGEGDEVTACLIKRKDGSTEIKAVDSTGDF